MEIFAVSPLAVEFGGPPRLLPKHPLHTYEKYKWSIPLLQNANLGKDIFIPFVKNEDIPNVEDNVFAKDTSERLGNPLANINPKVSICETS